MSLKSTAIAALMVAVASPAMAQDGPSPDDVLYALQDVSLTLEGLQVRNALATAEGSGNALLQLGDGTLVDLRMVEIQEGWAVRDISLVAGNADNFRGWTEPWRQRVAAAEDFLAGIDDPGGPQRAAEELAPLSWFEDPDESSRLWGMNPMTYRMMQTLQMMPTLQGPTGAGSPTNPVPRRER
ncbi:MAG: hypothetical protein GKS06_12020 [Acidobacteria bacterium]|nr:hypothetical protein [Acidobacteriota bacterium]